MPATLHPTHKTGFPSNSVAFPCYAQSPVDLILANVRRYPDRVALVLAGTREQRSVSYGELGTLIAGTAAGLARAGFPPKARVLILAPPSLRFYTLALGVLASGRVLVVVDGRMRRSRILHAMHAAAPDVVIGARSAMRWWPLVTPLRRARRFTIDGSLPGAPSADALRARGAVDEGLIDAHAPAIIAFSSGSTGPAKQIVRSHAVLLAQHRALAAALPASDDDVNLSAFPIAVLHNLCCGTTTVLPDADLRAAMARDVDVALDLIEWSGVTSLAAAPAFARAVSRRAIATRRVPSSVRHVVVGGGPVSRSLCTDVMEAFPSAETSAVYGATEAEPIAIVSMREISISDGDGFLVGRPVPDVEIAIDRKWEGSAGEVLVRGPHVVSPEGAAEDWHHTSDLARVDQHGRLWLLGRVGDAVTRSGHLLFAGSVEAAALSVPGVDAAGFVAHPAAPDGELAIELAPEQTGPAIVIVARVQHRLTRCGIDGIPIRVVPRIPMDARHESKVARDELARLLSRTAR